jgi:hypothetical protein
VTAPRAAYPGNRLTGMNRTTRWLLPAVLALLVVVALIGAIVR